MSSVSINDSTVGSLPESIRVTHSRDGRSPSLAVVEAVAALAGVTPNRLADEAGIVLYDHINPDALNALVRDNPGVEVSLSFTVDAYDVCVEPDEVVVRHTE
jgi:hypothetical protein